MRGEIKIENLLLQKFESDFAPLLFEAAIESKGDEFSHWMPWCHENYRIEESREFVEKVVASWEDTNDVWRGGIELAYAVFDAETRKFLGCVSLNSPNKNHRLFNLGYWIRISSQNRGVASRAAVALAKAAFEDLFELNRVEILAAVENIPSQRVAEKAGATREGVLRKYLNIGGRIHDAALFSFVREDFESGRNADAAPLLSVEK